MEIDNEEEPNTTNTIKGDGNIGLTAAGQRLDYYLTVHKPAYRTQLQRFIRNLTCRIRTIHALINTDNQPRQDTQFVLKTLREHYLNQAKDRFQPQMETYPFSLLRNYITTITKVNFKPSTKTQISIINKGIQQRSL